MPLWIVRLSGLTSPSQLSAGRRNFCATKHALLKLTVRASNNNALQFVGRVVKHSERIQEFLFHLSHGYHDALAKPVPRQFFAFLMDYPQAWCSYVPFDGDIPALHTLELRKCPVGLNSSKLSGLTSLSLIPVPLQLQLNIPELLATLSCMQDLRHLYLSKKFVSGANSFISSTTFNTVTIQKNNLPRLLVVARLSTIIAFISCVNIPLQTQVGLVCGIKHGAPLSSFLALSSLMTRPFIASSQWGKAKHTFSASERD